MSRIFITGDTHGDIDFHKLNTTQFPEGKTLTKSDYVIVCGDFGGIWDGDKQDKYIQKWYDEKPWTTLFVDGNHENFDLLSKYPVMDWNGGKIQKISDSIYHLMRGQIYTIDGKRFFTMGGASSHDKQYRKEGVSWWANELPTEDECAEGFDNLIRYDNKVDYIISHCAGKSVQRQLTPYYDNDIATAFLDMVDSSVEFKTHFCGHYHCDIDSTNKEYMILYNRIIEIKE